MTGHLTARCRLSSGTMNDIQILDINEAGCLAMTRMMRIESGDRLLVKLPGLEFKAAYVAWAEEGQAGFTFEEPLYGPVIQHMLDRFEQAVAA